ncbi:MAG: hypothetical protein IPM57_10745 [Oligoflexia bacterium]|nr:hypothetical protein [Oligoflexia bacterium]
MSLETLPKPLQERIIKIYELSIKGVDGEKQAAKRQLTAFMNKYKLTADDLLQQPKNEYVFSFKSEVQRKLLVQIIWSVLGKGWTKNITYANSKSVEIKLSKVDYAEIKVKYDVYKRDFAAMMDEFLNAFVLANDIYHKDDEVAELPQSPEDRRKAKRIGVMALYMDKSVVNKLIDS